MRQVAHAATPHTASTYPYNALAASCRERDTSVAEYEIHVDEIRAFGFFLIGSMPIQYFSYLQLPSLL